jgi:hypothetical protein
MDDQELINKLNESISTIYGKEKLYPLRGENGSYKLNGKQILTWYFEVIKKGSCHFKTNYDYDQNIDELLFISDEIVYFTALLYFYRPYINNPLKDSYTMGDKKVYPVFTNLSGKRYDMYLDVLFEKNYNYWDRIGDLIASYFPTIFKAKENIYFVTTIKRLEEKYKGNSDYDWLLEFVKNDFKEFNKERKKIVHSISKSTELKLKHLSNTTNYEETKKLINKRLSYPDYFKAMNEKCIIGFERTLNFLDQINKDENYNCG